MRFIGVLAGVILVLLVTLWWFQEKLIFYPFKTDPQYEYSFPVPFTEKYFTVGSHRIHSLLFSPQESKGLILFFHGNAGSLEDWGRVATEIAQVTSWSVWIVDYPGFGKSDGSIHAEAQLHDLAREFFVLAKREFPQTAIVIYGRSIGSGLAVQLAAEQTIHGLVLESPFWSLEKMAELIYPWVPTFLLKYRFHSNQRLSSIEAPILIVHGEGDEIIPLSQGRDLAGLNPRARFVSIAGGQHNDLEAFDEYWNSLKEFLHSIASRESDR